MIKLDQFLKCITLDDIQPGKKNKQDQMCVYKNKSNKQTNKQTNKPWMQDGKQKKVAVTNDNTTTFVVNVLHKVVWSPQMNRSVLY